MQGSGQHGMDAAFLRDSEAHLKVVLPAGTSSGRTAGAVLAPFMPRPLDSNLSSSELYGSAMNTCAHAALSGRFSTSAVYLFCLL